MRLTTGGVLAAAWALWRRDRDLLVRVAGAFLFLPVFALQLLLPLPDPPASAPVMDALRLQATFVSAHFGAFVVALAMTQLGTLLLLVLYCDRERPSVGQALRRATRLFPRFLLATLLVDLPARIGLVLLVLPGLLVLARTALFGPLMVAQAPLGAAASIGRSVRATAGQTAPLLALVALIWGPQAVVGEGLLALDAWLRAHGPNPVAVAMTDAAFALVGAAAGLAGILVAITAYRLLEAPSKGT